MTQSTDRTNAVAGFVACLQRAELIAMMCRLRRDREELGRADAMRRALARRYGLDLAGLLNLAVRSELEAIARELEQATEGSVGELRARLWFFGAQREAGTDEHLGSPLQPVPIVLGGKLVYPARGNGAAPPARCWPRPVPPPAEPAPEPPEQAPDSIEELLENADALLGARFGAGTRNKGAFGTRIAECLGVPETGAAEPDWRGEVEIKTVPVVVDRTGWWRVKEDPAVSMANGSPLAKLRKVLWIARVADRDDSPVLSWYYQEADDRVRGLLERDLHTRPKGGAGATTRGWYVHKRFFTDSGFLRSLNG